MRLTEQQYADLVRGRQSRPINPRAKFKNIRTEKNGQTFDSKWEAERFEQLRLMEAAGEIVELRAQVPFPLMVGDTLIGAYVADAVYLTADGRKVVEDAKGCKTPLYRWKAKHFRIQYGFPITEVRKK